MPVVRTKKQKTEFQPYSRTKNQEIKDQEADTNEPAPSDLSCPVEVIQNILKYADSPTLNQCLRVSKEFYQVAAPLLYSNVILKDQYPLTQILVGSELVDRPANRHSKAVVNLKSTALSAVQQITVFKHSCKRSSFASDTFPNLKTLLIVPHLNLVEEKWCADKVYCPILEESRPEKVVIYNSRYLWTGPADEWPMFYHELVVTSPTLTWIVDETCFGLKAGMNGLRVTCSNVKQTRIIICKTPSWLDKRAGRETVSDQVVNLKYMVNKMILPFLKYSHRNAASATIYLFRAEDNQHNSISLAVDWALEDEGRLDPEIARMFGTHYVAPPKPIYTIKTLNDYIEEGVEDELLEEELQYWREENARRVKKDKSGVVNDKANQVLD